MKSVSERIDAQVISVVQGEINERTTAHISLPVFSGSDICDDDAFRESARLNRFIERLARELYEIIASQDDSDARRVSYTVSAEPDISDGKITLRLRAAEYRLYRRSREGRRSEGHVVTMEIGLRHGHASGARILSDISQ